MTASASILFQDSLTLKMVATAALNYAGFANWTVYSGTVDLIGNGSYDFLPDDGLYVDLDGSTSDAGVLTTKQSFNFTAGSQYILYPLIWQAAKEVLRKRSEFLSLLGERKLPCNPVTPSRLCYPFYF